MRSISRYRPSPAMIVAIIAVVVASAGTAVAAKLITGKQLARNAVTSPKVKNGSLLKADFKAGQLPAGPAGPTGAAGPRGATGATGAQGRNRSSRRAESECRGLSEVGRPSGE